MFWRATNSSQLCHETDSLLVTLKWSVSWHFLQLDSGITFHNKRWAYVENGKVLKVNWADIRYLRDSIKLEPAKHWAVRPSADSQILMFMEQWYYVRCVHLADYGQTG